MSDGNFNRQLLPKTELASGLRAGKAQMRAKAEQAFKTVMEEYASDMPEEEKCRIINRFMELLRQ